MNEARTLAKTQQRSPLGDGLFELLAFGLVLLQPLLEFAVVLCRPDHSRENEMYS